MNDYGNNRNISLPGIHLSDAGEALLLCLIHLSLLIFASMLEVSNTVI